MIAKAIEMEGTLEAAGRLVLDEKPALPPGRVRVALQQLSEELPRGERLPDVPCVDTAIPAPFDLPRIGAAVRVSPRLTTERFPEILTSPEDEE